MISRIEVREYILFYAFRYALGRKTYAVSDVVNAIIESWDKLNEAHQMQIKHEIGSAIVNKNAGMKCDVEQWRRILEL